jgi:hypothetical protein
MSQNISGANQHPVSPVSDITKSLQEKHQKQASQLLDDYNKGKPRAIEQFHRSLPESIKPDFRPSMLQARMLVASNGLIVKRLSLEKLKKEAKDLLKELKLHLPDAVSRLETHFGKPIKELKLADAQFIIARENGLQSWAKLKNHVSLMNQALACIESAQGAPDNDLKTLHIRCGNDIEKPLEICGFKGDFLEVSNPFPQGPVPHFDPLEIFIQKRTDFITRSYSADVLQDRINNTATEIRHVEDVLRHAPERYDRIVMWYEHDSYDQLSKAYVLAHLAELNLKKTRIECIQIDGFPGVKKFIGIGQLGQIPEAMLALWPQREPITSAMMAFGARCWHAYTRNDPGDLWQLAQQTDSPLPLMQAALKRTLMELPWIENGLGLTEYLALDILLKEGPMRPGAIFNLLMTESDPLPFLGDIMLLAILRPLWESEFPAIKVIEKFQDENPMRQCLLEITEPGRSLLEGKANWLTINRGSIVANRHVGGIHIIAGKKNWCWSAEKSMPVLNIC